MVAQPVESSVPTDPHAGDAVFELHRGGKIEVTSSVHVRDADDLSKAYTLSLIHI